MYEIHSLEQLLKMTALVAAVISIFILLWYLVRRPPLGRMTKVMLLFGLGVMPIGVALTGNIAGFEYTLKREFCGSCHVMLPYTQDAADPASNSLAAIHSRNHSFGEESCYNCHADYQLFGAMTTKVNGLKHLFFYVTEYANTGPYGEGGKPIHMYKPFQNGMCTRCHSTTAPNWLANEDHARDARGHPQGRREVHRLPLRGQDPPARVRARRRAASRRSPTRRQPDAQKGGHQ